MIKKIVALSIMWLGYGASMHAMEYRDERGLPRYEILSHDLLALKKSLLTKCEKENVLLRAVHEDELHTQHIVHFLLQNGVDPNVRDDEGARPLHTICRDGLDPSYIPVLVFYGADVEALGIVFEPPLHTALKAHRLNHVRTLLELGANPNAITHFKIPALVSAAHSGKASLISLLLRFGADPYQRAIPEWSFDFSATPFKTACNWVKRNYLFLDSILHAGFKAHWCSDLDVADRKMVEKRLEEFKKIGLSKAERTGELESQGKLPNLCCLVLRRQLYGLRK